MQVENNIILLLFSFLLKEFRIWSRSFNKEKIGLKKFEYLSKVRDLMRKIKSIRLDKNFKEVARSE